MPLHPVAPAEPSDKPQQNSRRSSVLQRALVGLVALVVTISGNAWLLDASIDQLEEAVAMPSEGKAQLAAVVSWVELPQRMDVARTAQSRDDLIVVDEQLDGSREASSRARALALLKRKPDGGRRLVLSRLSVGAVSDSSDNWQSSWVAPRSDSPISKRLAALSQFGTQPAPEAVSFARFGIEGPSDLPSATVPAWLGPESPTDSGSYRVRYWLPEWREKLLGSGNAMLDRIIASGFDGVMISHAGVYADWSHENPSSKEDMIDLVADISTYARQKNAGFLVLLQNADEMLTSARLRGALDGVSKHDLLSYEAKAPFNGRQTADLEAALKNLGLARRDGLTVLIAEHMVESRAIEAARQQLVTAGFVPYFGPKFTERRQRAH
jgi:cysteinyl-tRNA synthetase